MLTSPKDPKRDNFKRLVNSRLSNVLKSLQVFENLSDTSKYSYTDQEAKKIQDVLTKAFTDCGMKFQLRGKSTPGLITFSDDV